MDRLGVNHSVAFQDPALPHPLDEAPPPKQSSWLLPVRCLSPLGGQVWKPGPFSAQSPGAQARTCM